MNVYIYIYVVKSTESLIFKKLQTKFSENLKIKIIFHFQISAPHLFMRFFF